MRLVGAHIKNFQSIEELSLEQISDITLLVGPNGCGKTAFFESFRLLLRHTATYGGGWRTDPNWNEFITVGQNECEIRFDFHLTDFEREWLPHSEDILSAYIKFVKGEGAKHSEHRSKLRRLFGPDAYSEPKVGKIEIIPSNRQYSRGPIGGIDLGPGYHEQLKSSYFASPETKFQQLKTILWRLDYMDMKARDTDKKDHSLYIDDVKEVFAHFLDNVELHSIGSDTPEIVQNIFVKTPRGVHDIDLLSSGEREVLMAFVLLVYRRHSGSIIFFDEPELHLHAGLEKKVLPFLRKIAKKPNNQFVLATHSAEIVSSVVDESIIRFTGGAPNKVININLNDEKLEVLRALGASTHAQLISKRILYVEGESDERLLTLFEPNLIYEATFVVTEGGATTPRVMDLLNKATRYENFRALIDRDHHGDPEIKRLEENSGEYLRVWKKRHIENYLLDPEAIYEELMRLSAGNKLEWTPSSSQDVLNALKEIAMEQPQIDLLARDILVTRIKDALPLRLGFNVDELNKEVHSFFEKARSAFQSIASDKTEVEKLIEDEMV